MRKVFILSILLMGFAVLPVWATSTGLNNIPTADVVPYNVLVFQYFGDFGNDNVPDHFAGFKYGLAENIEIGLDGRFYAEKSLNEWLVAQGKVRFDLASDLAGLERVHRFVDLFELDAVLDQLVELELAR